MVMRFIAGAVCPSCGARDAMRAEVSTEADTQYRECVDCGFEESATSGDTPAAQVDTRVASAPRDDGTQVIKIMPDIKGPKH